MSNTSINETFIVEPIGEILDFSASTISANTISAVTFYGDGSHLTGISTQDIFVTGGTYDLGTAVFKNNTGGTFSVSGFYTGYTAPTDVFVTGGTYDSVNGVATFINNTGGTFNVVGFENFYTTGATLVNDVVYFDRNDSLSAYTLDLHGIITTDTFITGVTFNNNNNVLTLYRNDNVQLTTSINSFNSITATTYYGDGSHLTGLSTQDTFITGGTYSNGTSIFKNNTGGTFSVSGYSTGYTLTSYAISTTLGYTPLSAYTNTYVTGGTYSNGTAVFTNNTGGTFSISGFSTATSFTGGTVNDLTATTISATTYLGLPIEGFIPYTGATQDVFLGPYRIDSNIGFTLNNFSGDKYAALADNGDYIDFRVSNTNTSFGASNIVLNPEEGLYTELRTNDYSQIGRIGLQKNYFDVMFTENGNEINHFYLNNVGTYSALGYSMDDGNGNLFYGGTYYGSPANRQFLFRAQGDGSEFSSTITTQLSSNVEEGNAIIYQDSSQQLTSSLNVGSVINFGISNTLGNNWMTMYQVKTIFEQPVYGNNGFISDWTTGHLYAGTDYDGVTRKFEFSSGVNDYFYSGQALNILADAEEGFGVTNFGTDGLGNVHSSIINMNTDAIVFNINDETYANWLSVYTDRVEVNKKVITNEGFEGNYVQLNTAAALTANVGEIVWNATDGTFDMGLLNGVTLQAGQELHIYGKAQGAIANGDAVQFAGAQGNHLLVKKAVPSEITANPEYFIGIATQDLANNGFGYITTFGMVHDLNTLAYPEGTVLYFQSSGTTAGLLTSTRPTGPLAKIIVCAVVRSHGTQGVLFVRPNAMQMLGASQDVEISGVTNGQVLTYDSTALVWKNKTLPSSTFTGGTISGATRFTNGLTANTISATTYQNLPTDIYSTGGTYSLTAQTLTVNNNVGNSFTVTGVGETAASINSKLERYLYKLTTASSSVTGTLSETQVLKVTIPANSFSSSDLLKIPVCWISKSGTTGTSVTKIKLSTSSTMPASNTDVIATYNGATTTLGVNINRSYMIDGGNIRGAAFTTSALTDVAVLAVVPSSKAFDPTITNYLYVSVTLSNATDSMKIEGLELTNV